MSGPACEALARGTLDAVLLALPWDCGAVEAMPLFEDPFFLVFHPGDMIDPPPQVSARCASTIPSCCCWRTAIA